MKFNVFSQIRIWFINKIGVWMRSHYREDFNRLINQSILIQCRELSKLVDEASEQGVDIHIFIDAATAPMTLFMMLDDDDGGFEEDVKKPNPFSIVEDSDGE